MLLNKQNIHVAYFNLSKASDTFRHTKLLLVYSIGHTRDVNFLISLYVSYVRLLVECLLKYGYQMLLI